MSFEEGWLGTFWSFWELKSLGNLQGGSKYTKYCLVLSHSFCKLIFPLERKTRISFGEVFKRENGCSVSLSIIAKKDFKWRGNKKVFGQKKCLNLVSAGFFSKLFINCAADNDEANVFIKLSVFTIHFDCKLFGHLPFPCLCCYVNGMNFGNIRIITLCNTVSVLLS